VRYDLAFGGNFYAILPLADLGIPFERAEAPRILDAGLAVMTAINKQRLPRAPDNPEIQGCHHVPARRAGIDARRSRHAMVIHPAGSTAPPAAPARARGWPSLHARGRSAR
jgi:proline racemase